MTSPSKKGRFSLFTIVIPEVSRTVFFSVKTVVVEGGKEKYDLIIS